MLLKIDDHHVKEGGAMQRKQLVYWTEHRFNLQPVKLA